MCYVPRRPLAIVLLCVNPSTFHDAGGALEQKQRDCSLVLHDRRHSWVDFWLAPSPGLVPSFLPSIAPSSPSISQKVPFSPAPTHCPSAFLTTLRLGEV